MLKPIDKAARPKSVKKKPVENPREVVIAKIFFLITLVIAALLISKLAANQPAKNRLRNNPDKTVVLGTHIAEGAKSAANDTIDAAQKQAAILKQAIEKQVGELLLQKRSEIESSVSALLFDSTLKPLIDRFNQLPPEQKEAVKQAICK